MKKLIPLLVLAGIAWYGSQHTQIIDKSAISASSFVSQISPAFTSQDDGTQVSGRGEVVRLLPDDINGSQHQRFILKLASGQTLLVAHNIDVAPKLSRLRLGDEVAFHGEYVWNEQGGLIHWTHANPNPRGHHPHGWLEHDGRRYE